MASSPLAWGASTGAVVVEVVDDVGAVAFVVGVVSPPSSEHAARSTVAVMSPTTRRRIGGGS
jgi:hypothetical protein